MYQNKFFYIDMQNQLEHFAPSVCSAFLITADGGYFHKPDYEEKEAYPENTQAFVRCIEGRGKISCQGKEYVLKENDCLFLPFDKVEFYQSEAEIWSYRWVNFTTPSAGGQYTPCSVFSVPATEYEEKAFCRLMSYGGQGSPDKSYVNALFIDYFYTVMRQNTGLVIRESAEKSRISEICSFLEQQIYTKSTIEDTAAFFKLSPRRLHQIFTAETGISPKQYLQKKKLEEGYRLIVQTSLPVGKIAYMLGFNSPYHFSNAFKKTFNATPTEVRRL